jgi:hypothetical protein
MSYLWSDKITDYYYSNPELNTVAVLWTSPDDDLVREHYIMVDEEDEQFRDFLKVVSYEDIDKRTQVRHEQFREQFRESFRDFMSREQSTSLEQAALAKESYLNAETKVPIVDTVVDTVVDKNPENIELTETNIPQDSIFDMFFGSYDNDNSNQKEQLFKLKLKIFEQDIVKNSNKDDNLKNAKTFIRKAKSPMEVLLGYMVFSNTAELTMNEKEKFEVEGVYIPLK